MHELRVTPATKHEEMKKVKSAQPRTVSSGRSRTGLVFLLLEMLCLEQIRT